MKQRSFSLTIGGVLVLLLAVFHIFFWKIFEWNQTLTCLNNANRGVMYALNIVAIISFIAMTVVTLFYQHELVSTKLGKFLLFWFALLWIVRFVLQFILWEFTFNIPVTILAIVFLYLAIVYLLVLLKKA